MDARQASKARQKATYGTLADQSTLDEPSGQGVGPETQTLYSSG